MKRYGLLTLMVLSPIGAIVLFFTARVCYKNYYYLKHLYPGDLASTSIGTPAGEMFRMWLSLLIAVGLLVLFIILLINYLKENHGK